MDDRELLELAAKAAGVGPLDFDYAKREGHGFYMGPRLPMPQGVVMAAMWSYWNPLTDDGDALRLAVKLQLQVTPGTYNKDQFSAFHAGQGEANEYWSSMQDDYAATRRAIVRAAAELGRQMQNV